MTSPATCPEALLGHRALSPGTPLQVAALKSMNLNVRRAKIKAKDGNIKNKFFVTDSHTADKIMKSKRLEEIRLSILQNLQFYHPEAGEQLAWGRKAKKQASRTSLEPLGMSHRCSHPPCSVVTLVVLLPPGL